GAQLLTGDVGPDGFDEGERGFNLCARFAEVAAVARGARHPIECLSFTAPVPDFALDRERLLVVVACLLVLAQVTGDIAEVNECRSLTPPVLELALDRERLHIVVECLLVLAQDTVD